MTMTAEPRTRSVVYNLGHVERLPLGEGRTFQIAGRAIAVFRTRSGEVYATQATCPHKGGPLADGIVGANKVVCPLHSYKFDLASGEPIGAECQQLATYPVTINEEGCVLLRLC